MAWLSHSSSKHNPSSWQANPLPGCFPNLFWKASGKEHYRGGKIFVLRRKVYLKASDMYLKPADIYLKPCDNYPSG